MSGAVLVVIEHDRGTLDEVSWQAIGLAQECSANAIHAVVIGDDAAQLAGLIPGVSTTHHARHDALSDYAPEAWGDVIAQLSSHIGATAIVATGTDRGNEVLAHAAAALDAVFVSNVVAYRPSTDTGPAELTRVRWGGSLLEHATVAPGFSIMSAAPHAFAAAETNNEYGQIVEFTPTLSDTAPRTRVADRITLASGITLQTAPVVVSGGRGVGSAEGFATLEALADLLGGAVGCSRVVTNQGWRPHSDQVGQTGKRVAPELYIACGISGAIQHWIGMQAAQRILAINLDKDAPMVTKGDYAVIGDLHEILPAIIAELQRRR